MPMAREPHSLIGAMFQSVPGNSVDYRRPELERRMQRQREKELAKDMFLTKKSRNYKVANAGQEWVEKRFNGGARASKKSPSSKLPNINSDGSEAGYSDGEIAKACATSLPTQYPQYLGQVMAYSPYKTPFRRATTIPKGFRGNRFLQHPDLKRGQRSYLWHIAAIYDISNMKKLHQNNYERVLLNQEALGFLDSQEFRRYWRYLKGSRKTQFETDCSVWREPPKIKPRLTRSHSVQDEYSQRALREQQLESKRSQSEMAVRHSPSPPQTPRPKKETRSPRTLKHRKGKVMAQDITDSDHSESSQSKDGKANDTESSLDEKQTDKRGSQDTSGKKGKGSEDGGREASQSSDGSDDRKEEEKKSASIDEQPTNQNKNDRETVQKTAIDQKAENQKEAQEEEIRANETRDEEDVYLSDRTSPEY